MNLNVSACKSDVPIAFLGIKEVIFMSDKYHDTPEMTAARRLFDLAGIIYRWDNLPFFYWPLWFLCNDVVEPCVY